MADMKGTQTHCNEKRCSNPGNPVFTCDQDTSNNIRDFVPEPKTKEVCSNKQHPMYTTSSGAYGSQHATVETVPQTFHGKVQRFTEHLAASGMYRNHSVNTAGDKSVV